MKANALAFAAVCLAPAVALALLMARAAKRPAPAPQPERVHICERCAGIDPLLARMDLTLWNMELEDVQ